MEGSGTDRVVLAAAHRYLYGIPIHVFSTNRQHVDQGIG